MIRKIALSGLAAIITTATWFVAASYLFVILIGAREKWANHALPITGFYDRLIAADYHPWLAYWTFLGTPDPQIRSMIFAAGSLPFPLAIIVALIGWRIARIARLRARLVRYPWQGDNPTGPTSAA